MELGKMFKKMMIDKDIKQLKVAEAMGITKQNFNDKLKADNFRINDIIKIADILGYDIKLQIIDRENQKVMEMETDNTK